MCKPRTNEPRSERKEREHSRRGCEGREVAWPPEGGKCGCEARGVQAGQACDLASRLD